MISRQHQKLRGKSAISAALCLCVGLLAGCGGQEYRSKATQTTRSHYFLDANNAVGRYEGLEDVRVLSTGVLEGKVSRWANMPVKEAPIVRTDTIKVTKANPVGATFATLFTVGLYPLLAPKEAWNTTVGKEESTASNEAPDYSKARNTGRFQWQELKNGRQEYLQISIAGKNFSRMFTAYYSGDPKSNFSFDLKNEFLQQTASRRDGDLEVSVSCDCRISGNTSSASSQIRALTTQVNFRVSKTTHPALFGVLEEKPSVPLLRKDNPRTFKLPDSLR